MKSNWGNWIAVAYTAFVVLIGFMVYLTFGEQWDLVSEDYYEQEIRYQEKIDQKNQALEDKIKPQVSIEGDLLKVTFPSDSEGNKKSLSGRITFFRPSDAKKDVNYQIVSGGEQSIPLERFSRGKYLAKIQWEMQGLEYYSEQTIIIP